jgi:hypothetical protein
MSDFKNLEGGCACGAVRFQTAASPRRVGLCHCMTCRKAHSSAFNPFVVFAIEDVEIVGELDAWESSPGHERRFCSKCGSRIAMQMRGTDEIELSLGSFDAVGVFGPGYESWISRREPWLEPLGVPQNLRDRDAG